MHCSQVARKATSLPVAEVAEAVFVRNRDLTVNAQKNDVNKSVQPTVWLAKHTRKKAFVFNTGSTATATQPTEKKENETQPQKQEVAVTTTKN